MQLPAGVQAEPPPGALIFLPLSTSVNSPTKSSKINCDLCQLSGRAFVAHKDEVYEVSALPVRPVPWGWVQQALPLQSLTEQFRPRSFAACALSPSGLRQGIAMNEEIKSPIISRRKVFWLAAIAAALAAPATMLSTSNARAQQSDQAPAAEPTAPKTGEKKKKKKEKKKKASPGSMTAPASTAPAPPKQQ